MRLPVLLDGMRVATPCSADWDDMRSLDGERVRFCQKCERNVYNLSALTRVEAETLVNAHEGRMCVRFFQRDDGTMLTADCPVAVEKKRLRARVWARISGAAASLALLVGFAGRASADVSITEDNNSDGNATQQPKPREKKREKAAKGEKQKKPLRAIQGGDPL
jgi:hypothetical protein